MNIKDKISKHCKIVLQDIEDAQTEKAKEIGLSYLNSLVDSGIILKYDKSRVCFPAYKYTKKRRENHYNLICSLLQPVMQQYKTLHNPANIWANYAARHISEQILWFAVRFGLLSEINFLASTITPFTED